MWGEERLGGLVGRVLRDEVAAEGALEDGAAEGGRLALRALGRGADRSAVDSAWIHRFA